ncbi:neuraminidase-like domain-containing protein [Mycobacterium sp. OTB74]|uniref:neuraminidase-like domain-containing protein n=1 Tax=Mycobacterium sp. OTB74 TaxID=1853452 RepID=UPI002476E694|nr:neuraminidase-like domain-containing protein [Mycobacterium sp. OTB74]MDH6245480.1 hypothetical protein [Mycobacterium sp. OTB74]
MTEDPGAAQSKSMSEGPAVGSADRMVGATAYVVTGTVSSPSSVAVGGLNLRLVDKNVGGDVALVSGQSASDGSFTLTAEISLPTLAAHHKSSPDLQVQVMIGGSIAASSVVRYKAGVREELDVVLPVGTALPSEYETLVAAVGQHYVGSLADLEESDTRQDITYLSNTTFMDGRLIAMASVATQAAKQGGANPLAPAPAHEVAATTAASTPVGAAGIDPAFYYALLRAGLPSDPTSLHQTNPDRAEAIWKQAITQNIIPAALGDHIAAAKEVFTGIAASVSLNAAPAVGPSTLSELLDVSVGSANTSTQQQFASLLVKFGNDPATLWAQTEEALGSAVCSQLQMLGQMAYATGGNAALIAALYQSQHERPLTSPADLVPAGFYTAAAWQTLLANVNPPAEIPGATTDEQKANYANLLAAQVRLSYPTATVGHMASTGGFGQSVSASGAGAFLLANSGFDLGDEPIGQYLSRTGTSVSPEAITQITRMQRVYQITTDLSYMTVLLGHGLDSAYALTRLGRAQFAQQYAQALGGPEAADAIYQRAQVIHAATMHTALSYLAGRQQPTIGAGAFGGLIAKTSAAAQPTAVAATLEGLFGDLDYSQCDDCQSITGPAAYLVDLLDWIYNSTPTAHGLDPRAVLLSRRPDIGALPLTCENTNLVLPYLDLVNEVLEYYVGNQGAPESLSGFTGYSDDGTVSSAELVAAPQNDDTPTAVAAYRLLQSQWYPEPLPFYRDLELLRLHIARLGITLHQLMEVMRASEALEAPAPTASDPNPFGWRDILAERLGISRLENRLLTDSTLTLADIYGTSSIAKLSALQEYSRITALAYTDIVAILRTRFINPGSWLIELLDALALPFATLTALHNGTLTAAAFTAQLPAGLNTTDYGTGGVAAWVMANYTTIAQLIVIDVAGASSDTTKMTLQHLNGDPLADIDFVRLARFTRLWHKLGLTVAQTDNLIGALFDDSAAAAAATPLQRLDSGFLTLLPRAGIAYQAMDLLALDPATDLASLLACWAPIATTGTDSLYTRMFLNPTVLGLDAAFAPDINGALFTSSPAPTLLAHRPAVIAALNVTGGEFDLITGPAPLGLGCDATTALSAEVLSQIYRRAWLARTLGLSVLELLSLITYTGVDPFALPVINAADPVRSPLVEFIRRAQSLQAAGLLPVQALYLLWNTDLSGVAAPAPTVTTALASALRTAFIAVDAQFSVGDTVSASTGQALMSVVLGANAANEYFGLLQNTFATSIPFGYTQSTLPGPALAAANGLLSYDDIGKQLTYYGYLNPATVAALQSAATGDTALTGGITALAAANEQAVTDFFAAYDDPTTPYLRPLFNAYVTATTGATAQTPEAALATLLAGLLPALGNLRRQEQALGCATAAAGCDPTFAPALLNTRAAIPAANPAATTSAPAGIDDLTALHQGGLSAQFFLTNDPSAVADQSPSASGLDYGPDNPLPPPNSPATTIAGRWDGYLCADQDGDYNLRFTTDPGAAITSLIVNGTKVQLQQSTNTDSTVSTNLSAVALRAGELTPITITATGLQTTFTASWETVGVAWAPIASENLYSKVLVSYLQTTLLRFLKATALAADLSLTADEIAYLATDAGLTVGGKGWLAVLDVDSPAAPASYPDLTTVLDGLVTFAALKASYSPRRTQTPQLLATLQHAAAATPGAASELLALTRWDPLSLQPVLGRLFGVTTANVTADASLAAFAQLPNLFANLLRLQSAFRVISSCQLSAATLIEAATNDPSRAPGSTILADFQSAVRSRYQESDWLTVVQPINDTVRTMQRDALVAYILVTSGPVILTALGVSPTPNRLPTPDDLFNYFLLDVEMAPCMLTSRVRLALSSVLLFIERCLRNLEPSVTAADIHASQWNWRKRYRVWQANREVFLWPENWLDENLRDDRSPFFKTTMSQLLQSDITADTAAQAYLDYLSNLELVAKLDPCGLFCDPDTNTTHVIARGTGASGHYFYRKSAEAAWTPWEQIKLNIEDVPVVPCVWNGRLLLFWLQIHYAAANSPDKLKSNMPAGGGQLGSTSLGDVAGAIADKASDLTMQNVGAVLFWSEYYNGAWQPPKSSDVANPLLLGTFLPGTFDRTTWMLRPWTSSDPNNKSLYLEVTNNPPPAFAGTLDIDNTVTPSSDGIAFVAFQEWGLTNGSNGFVLHNTHSDPPTWLQAPGLVSIPGDIREVDISNSTGPTTLTINYDTLGGTAFTRKLKVFETLTVLTGSLPAKVELAQPSVANQWWMPFFFGDARSVFYVTSSQHWVPIGIFNGFGLTETQLSAIDKTAVAIPPLVVPPAPPDTGLPAPTATIDTALAHSAVTSGAMRAVISGGGPVLFGSRSIGINSSIDAVPPTSTATTGPIS